MINQQCQDLSIPKQSWTKNKVQKDAHIEVLSSNFR